MRKTWSLLQYYYLWQPIIPMIVVLGIVLFLVKILIAPYSDSATFITGLAAFVFLFVIPFCSGATALRGLISNPQTILVPGFKQRAVLVHLLIAVIASVFLYVNFLVFNPNPTSPLAPLWVFVAFSLYSGFMQLILPSRFFVMLISFSPMVFVILTIQFRESLVALFVDRLFMGTLGIISLAGWIFSYHLVGKRNQFKPANTSLHCTESWASYDGGLLNHLALGKSRTAQGTLLLGYPDNWWDISLRVINYFILTPLLTTGILVVSGITDKWDAPKLQSLVSLFLLISLFSGVFTVFIHGELVARARLVWLRFGSDRRAHWQLVNSYCVRFLLVYYACGALITLLAGVVTNVDRIHLLHFMLVLVSYCYFNLYFSLLVRICKLPPLLMAIVTVVSVVCVGFSMIMAAGNDTSPTYALLIGAESILFLLGMACNLEVKNRFTRIDWQQVKVKQPNAKFVQTHD